MSCCCGPKANICAITGRPIPQVHKELHKELHKEVNDVMLVPEDKSMACEKCGVLLKDKNTGKLMARTWQPCATCFLKDIYEKHPGKLNYEIYWNSLMETNYIACLPRFLA